MPIYDLRCTLCGLEMDDVYVPTTQKPPCYWCEAPTESLWRTPSAVIGDEWPGGGSRTFENLGHEPVVCQNKSDLQKEMDKRGLRHPDRWVPGDRHLTNWAAAIDAQTLDNARVLLSRAAGSAGASGEPPVRCETATFTIRDLGPGEA